MNRLKWPVYRWKFRQRLLMSTNITSISFAPWLVFASFGVIGATTPYFSDFN
jgi:hypothetical protein